MAEKILNTKIRLLIKTYAEWEAIKGTFKPLRGEVCLCEIPASPVAGSAEATTAPTVLFKVGDGLKTFGELKWASALAADVYSWAKVDESTFVTNFLGLTDTTGKTIEDKLNGVFATDAELAGAVAALEKKITDLSVAALEARVKTTEDTIKTYGDIVTHDAAEFATVAQGAKADSAVQNVAIGSVTAENKNGTALFATADVQTELGLESAAYVTVESLNATAKGYADAVEAKIPTEVGVMSIAKGDDTIIIGGTVKDPTIKVDSSKFDASGAAAAALEAAKKYADEKPHENTAHAHAVGDGLAMTGNGGIEGEVKYELNLEFGKLTTDNKLQLLDATNKVVIAEFDAAAFVKDSFLEGASYDETTNDLTLTFVDNSDNKQDIVIPLDDLVDVYTADETSITLTTSGDGKVFKVNEAGIETKHIKDGAVTTAKIADDAVTADKLADAINTDIAKGVTAEGWGDHSKAGYAIDAQLGALAKKDKVVEGDIDGTIGVSKITNFATEVAGIRVENADNAGYAGNTDHANSADYAEEAGRFGGEEPSYYATAERVKALEDANHISEVTTTPNQGLKVTGKNKIDIDDAVVFVFNCNYDSNTFYINGTSFQIPEGGTWADMLGTEGFNIPGGDVITYNTKNIYNTAGVAQKTTDGIVPGEMYHT